MKKSDSSGESFSAYLSAIPRNIATPFAWYGDRRTFEADSIDKTDVDGYELFPNYRTGIPPIYARDVNKGGKFVERQTSNGIGFIASLPLFLLQLGVLFEYNGAFAEAIGGYPMDATLWWKKDNKHYVLIESLVNDNNFIPNKLNVASSTTTSGLITTYKWREVSFTDNDVVTLATEQTVTGTKTFTTIKHPAGSVIKTNAIEKNATIPSDGNFLAPYSYLKDIFWNPKDSNDKTVDANTVHFNKIFAKNINASESLSLAGKVVATEEFVKEEISKLNLSYTLVDRLPSVLNPNTLYMVRTTEQ